MEIIDYLLLGFKVSLQPENLLYCFTGTLIGTLIGVLPGIGPVGTISILLPITVKISPSERSSCWRGFITERSTEDPQHPFF